jgi:hypothetical protein
VATFRLTQFITALLLLLVSYTAVPDIHAQGTLGTPEAHKPTTSVSLIYTGRSLGALGVLRDPDENGLLIEQANQTNSSLRLATYVSWRSPTVAIFTPGTDLQLEDLEFFLDNPPHTNDFVSRPALRSNNVTMTQDPAFADTDLLALTHNNPRAAIEFPDLISTNVSIAQLSDQNGRTIIVMADGDITWPTDPDAWTQGEVNRIDVDGSTLYGLPVNLGQIGPRATLLRQMVADTKDRDAHPLIIDLGGRDGDLGLERYDRAVVDYLALSELGYTLVVPYELELALGASGLSALSKQYPSIQFIATNITNTDTTDDLFLDHAIVTVNDVSIGLFGIIDPELQDVLGKSSLEDFSFESPLDSAEQATEELRAAGVDAVIMLSNLHPRDNALVAREVEGIDAIVADLHVRWSPEDITTTVELPARPLSRLGSPALVPRSFANGLGLGQLNLSFQSDANGSVYLNGLSHTLSSVTDRTEADAALVSELRTLAEQATRPRGDVLLPAFGDLVAVRPPLENFDDTTILGRVSKPMWEEFIARLLRYRGSAEVGIIRNLPHFPPAIGALREADIRAWLWTEDAVVILDLLGADLLSLLEDDETGDLVTSGIDLGRRTIHGRRINPTTLYRVATTDVIYEGSRARAFARSRRPARFFEIETDGNLHATNSGQAVPLRAFMLQELNRLRTVYAGSTYLEIIATLLDRDLAFEPLTTFEFDRPTIFGTFNNTVNNDGFGAVNETRVNAMDSAVYGVSGRFQSSSDFERYGLDLGVTTAFSRQVGTRRVTKQQFKIESRDDLQFDLTVRRKLGAQTGWQPQPFVRSIFDTEYTPTINFATFKPNPKQLLFRNVGGFIMAPGRWNEILVGVVVEDELNFDSREYGVELSTDYRRRFGAAGALQYRSTNRFNYFFPAGNDDNTDLGVQYRMSNEILIPLVAELSLSISADVYFFRGKIPAMQRYGANSVLRVGLTYDRLWKPRYQPFF